MQFRGGCFQREAWTFADYSDKENMPFFIEARKMYMEKLKGQR